MKLVDMKARSGLLMAVLACGVIAPVVSHAQLPTVTAGSVLDLSDITDPFDPDVIIPSARAYFGSSMAADGDYAILAGMRPGGDGRAYLYSYSPFGWTRERRLDEDAFLDDLNGFGAAVSMNKGTAAILQRKRSGGTTAIHLFSADWGWTLETTLGAAVIPADLKPVFDFAGITCLAVSGDTLVLGNEKSKDSKTGALVGRVVVLTRSAAGWTVQASLTAADATNGDKFGQAVAVHGDRLLVGAPGTSGSQGACYVFERSGNAWKQTHKLLEPGGARRFYFGSTVALEGGIALVGSPTRRYSNVTGTVSSFYHQANGSWRYEGLLPVPQAEVSPAAPAPAHFGERLSLSGSLAAVGTAYSSETGRNSPERSYLYQRRGDRWVQLAPVDGSSDLSAPGGITAVAGSNWLVGDPLTDTGAGTDSGKVRAYEVRSGLAVFDGSSLTCPEITNEPEVVLDLGDVLLGRAVKRSFTVQNLGKFQVDGLSVYGDDAEGSTLTVPTETELPVNRSVTTTLALTPVSEGYWESAIYLSGYTDTYVGTTIRVIANVIPGPAEKPYITGNPQSQLVWDQAPVSFSIEAGGTQVLGFQWLKDGRVMTGQNQRELRLPQATAVQAGNYTARVSNVAGSVVSASAALAVYQLMPETKITINDGAPTILTAPVTGPGVRYQWFHNQVALVDDSNVSGATTRQLRVKSTTPVHAGQFSVTLNPGGSQVTPQRWNVAVLQRPQVLSDPTVLAALDVAHSVNVKMVTSTPANRFIFRSVPPGIIADIRRGTLTGKPTRPGRYLMSIVAENAAGAGAAKEFPITVTGLDSRSLGTYRGVISRHSGTNGLGGMVQCSTTAAGGCTGTLTTGSRTIRINVPLFQSTDNTAYLATVDASTATTTERYELRLTIATGRLTGTVQTSPGGAAQAVLTGWINPWSALNPSAAWSNYCTAAITPKNTVTNFSLVPGGTSYTTLRFNTNGTVAWAGRMADGSVTTLSTTLSPTLINPDSSDAVEATVFLLLSGGTGSVLGTTRLNQSNFLEAAYHRVTGDLDWFKLPAAANSKTRSYKQGITRHDLAVNGAGYTAPLPGLPPLGLPPTQLNARMQVTGAGFEAAAQAVLMNPSFTLSGALAAFFPPPNALSRTLLVNRTQGTFSGSFKLTDSDILNPAISVVRQATFHGVLLSRDGSGAGFVSLPEMPDIFVSPPTTVNTSPIRSARLSLAPSAVP
jgi:hypothetical protein